MDELSNQNNQPTLLIPTVEPQKFTDATESYFKLQSNQQVELPVIIDQSQLIQQPQQSKPTQDKQTSKQQTGREMQQKLQKIDLSQALDLTNQDICKIMVWLLQKQIKSSLELALLTKFVRSLSVFHDYQDFFQASQLLTKIIANLRCVFIPKYKPLFKFGDRGNEYFILLQGKAYCLIPRQTYPTKEQLKNTPKNKRLAGNICEEKTDEDFLFETYPRFQCVKIYKPGEAFGEIALLTEESKRMASIVCKEDCYFMSLEREGFLEIQGSYEQHLLNEKVQFLKRFSMFEGIPVNRMLSLLHDITETSYQLSHAVYTQRTPAKTIYFVLNGEIQIEYQQHVNSSQNKSNHTQTLQSQQHHQQNSYMFAKQLKITKPLVRFVQGNYFGDEDAFIQSTTPPTHTFTATCVSESATILSIPLEQLLSFIKGATCPSEALKKIAAQKRMHYFDILSKEKSLDQLLIAQLIADKIPQINSTSENPNKKSNPFSNKSNSNSDQPHEAQKLLRQLSPKSSINSSNSVPILRQSLKLHSSSNNNNSNSGQVPAFRFQNVFSIDYTKDKNQLNLMSFSLQSQTPSQYPPSHKYCIEDDLLKTTEMNINDEAKRRLEYRLRKNLSFALNPKEPLPAIPVCANQSTTSRIERILNFDKSAKQLIDSSFESVPQFSLSSARGHSYFSNNHMNSLTTESQSTRVSDKNRCVQVLNMSPVFQSRVEESINHRKKVFLDELSTLDEQSSLGKQPSALPSQCFSMISHKASRESLDGAQRSLTDRFKEQMMLFDEFSADSVLQEMPSSKKKQQIKLANINDKEGEKKFKQQSFDFDTNKKYFQNYDKIVRMSNKLTTDESSPRIKSNSATISSIMSMKVPSTTVATATTGITAFSTPPTVKRNNKSPCISGSSYQEILLAKKNRESHIQSLLLTPI